MDIKRMLSELHAERSRIDRAIAALEQLEERSSAKAAVSNGTGPKRRRRRRGGMSAEARKRMSEMMRKRWAERKKAKA